MVTVADTSLCAADMALCKGRLARKRMLGTGGEKGTQRMAEAERIQRLREVSGADTGCVVGYQNLRHDEHRGTGVDPPCLVNRWLPHFTTHREPVHESLFGANQVLVMEFSNAGEDRYTGGVWWGTSGIKGRLPSRRIRVMVRGAQQRLALLPVTQQPPNRALKALGAALPPDEEGYVRPVCPIYCPPHRPSVATPSARQPHFKGSQSRLREVVHQVGNCGKAAEEPPSVADILASHMARMASTVSGPRRGSGPRP